MKFIILEATIFELSSKTSKMQYLLNTFALKNYGKFADHNLENLCPRSLASTIPVHENSVLNLGLRFFLSPWPLRLCPRLHL